MPDDLRASRGERDVADDGCGRSVRAVRKHGRFVLLRHFGRIDWLPFHPEIRQCWDGVSWYLSALFFCYLIYPFFLNRSKKGDWIVLICIGAVEILVMVNHRLPFFSAREFAYYFPPTRFLEFLLGTFAVRAMISTEQIKQSQNLKSNNAICLLIVLSLFSILGVVFAMPSASLGFACAPLFALALAALISRELSRGVQFRCLAPLVFMGHISFEFFMLHAIVLGLCCAYIPTQHPTLVSIPLALFVSIVFAHVLHLILRPKHPNP